MKIDVQIEIEEMFEKFMKSNLSTISLSLPMRMSISAATTDFLNLNILHVLN